MLSFCWNTAVTILASAETWAAARYLVCGNLSTTYGHCKAEKHVFPSQELVRGGRDP